MDDLEQVGLTTDSNTLMPGEENGLDVYRVKGGEATDVFTYVPSSTWVNPEDGQTFTSRAGGFAGPPRQWRWAAHRPPLDGRMGSPQLTQEAPRWRR